MTVQGDSIRTATAELEALYTGAVANNVTIQEERDHWLSEAHRLDAAVDDLQAQLTACQEGHEPPDDPPPVVANAAALAGVHVLQQIESTAQLNSQRTQILAALAVPGVSTFCARVPWSAIDTSFTLLDQCKAVADQAGKQFAVRFMAGRWTPQRIMLVIPTLTAAGVTFPRPYDTSGALNLPFLNAYKDLLSNLSAWCTANHVRIIHLSHYAKDWAEFYYGPEVQTIMGNTAAGQTAMVQATLALANVALNTVHPDISVELPMSGHGPLMRAAGSSNPGIAERVTMGIASGIGGGSDRFIIQGNGVDNDGLWGAPNEDTEVLMDNVLKANLFFGGQMIQPTNTWQWNLVFDQVQGAKATYLEVYLPSFSGGTSSTLKTESGLAMQMNGWRVS